MNITTIVWDSCPNGIDCEKTYGTDSGGVVLRLDRTRVVDPATVGLKDVPPHEFLVFVPEQQWNGGRP